MKITFKTGKGINRDQLPSELAPGVWSDCQNMRFRNGADERVGGLAAVFTTPLVSPYWMQLYSVGAASSITKNLVYAGITKAYVDDGTTQSEITRYLEGARISTMTNATAILARVTTITAHGLSVGDPITVWGTTPDEYNVTTTVSAVGSATQFDYAAALSGPATTVGFFSKNTTTNFTGAVDNRWTGGVLGGVLIANNPIDGLYYWAGDTTIRMRRFVNGSASFIADVARVYRNFVVLFGMRTSTSAVRRPYRINWSKSQEPGAVPGVNDFTASTTNDAGGVDKAETPGTLVDGLAYGDSFIVYKEDARIAMQWVGGIDVFSFRYLPGTDGLLATDCVVNTPKGQVFLTQNLDVKIHQGGEAQSVIDGRNLNWLRSNIDSTYYKRAFLAVNKKYSEVWVCIPTTGNTACNKALLWNWENDTWGERDLSGVTFGTSGSLPSNIATDDRLVVCTTTPRIGLTDSGTSDFGSAFTSMVERKGISTDDPESIKNLQGTRWQDDGTAGATSTVSHGSSMTADGSVTYATGVTNTLGTTNWTNARATGGRYMAIKRSTTAEIGRCRSVDLDFTISGNR